MDPIPSPTQPSLFELFGSFFRLGLTAFGGPSMVAYIRKLAVDQKGWLDKEIFNQLECPLGHNSYLAGWRCISCLIVEGRYPVGCVGRHPVVCDPDPLAEYE
jgi:hypothetical protein